MQNTHNIKKINIVKYLKIAFVILCILIFSIGAYLFLLSNTLRLDNEKLQALTTPVCFVDNAGNEISYGIESPYVSIKELNKHTIDAFICIEDVKFYTHKGINLGRIAKAFVTNISSGSIIEGASTISQQLIKNTHLSNEKTYSRKVKEILLTFKLENAYSKDEIMEMYLNAIYFGNGCYGLESAALFYFGIQAQSLNINQSAILAGLIKSPEYLSPINYTQECIDRKNIVLAQMYKYGKISQKEYEEL